MHSQSISSARKWSTECSLLISPFIKEAGQLNTLFVYLGSSRESSKMRDSRRALLTIRYAKCIAECIETRTRFLLLRIQRDPFWRSDLFILHVRDRKTNASRARRLWPPSAVLRNRSQERRSQFCATSMSRMSSIAGGLPIAVYGQWQISGCADNGRFSGAPNASVAADNETRPPMMRVCCVSRKPLGYLYC